jgi:hypothetical protein
VTAAGGEASALVAMVTVAGDEEWTSPVAAGGERRQATQARAAAAAATALEATKARLTGRTAG